MAVAKDIVTWAASQIGVKESPANSNKVKFWDMYNERCGVNLQGAPWCACFASLAWDIAGVDKMTKDLDKYRWCPGIVSDAKAKGLWRTREQGGNPGDKVIFGNKGTACHVGIVEKVISGTKYQTIEGNTSTTSNDNGGAVMRRTRELGTVGSSWYIMGFVACNPSGTTAAKPATEPAEGKSNAEVAREIYNGTGGWGNNPERRERLIAKGYDPDVIQNLVNVMLDVKTPAPSTPESGYLPGNYQVQVSSYLRVRTGPGTGYPAKTRSQVTADARNHWYKDGLANGTRASVTKISNSGNEVWGLIPSGWICIKQNGSTFAKRI